ncbi:MAG: hypothetical protein D6820_14875 [Lentisphaerae bacterium]|nr:MAG: hypothetical protein D6820_14875 [Lentisphaerota bacterium]
MLRFISKGWKSILGGILIGMTANWGTAQENSELQQLRSRLSVLENEVQQLKKGGGGAGGLQLPNAESLKLTGDLRLRYEHGKRDNGGVSETRNRFRTRFRLGLTWQPGEDWEIAAGLATGSDDPTSTNDTWSENRVFETGDLRLDYAYVTYYFLKEKKQGGEVETIAAIGGQQKNPYVHSGLLMWSDDVRPAGLTLKLQDGPVFLTMGSYVAWYKSWGQGATPMLYAGQAGIKFPSLGKKSGTLALAYYHFDNQLEPVTGNPDYSYQVLNAYADFPITTGPLALTLFGEWDYNLAADGNPGQGILGGTIDPEANNQAWAAGVSAKVGKWQVKTAYVYTEADSLYEEIKNSDFGSTAGMPATDVEGYTARLRYYVSKRFSIDGTMYRVKRIDGGGTNNKDDAIVYQLNFIYKF